MTKTHEGYVVMWTNENGECMIVEENGRIQFFPDFGQARDFADAINKGPLHTKAYPAPASLCTVA
jgi:hypothetical protein